jgi:hypothetical protein
MSRVHKLLLIIVFIFACAMYVVFQHASAATTTTTTAVKKPPVVWVTTPGCFSQRISSGKKIEYKKLPESACPSLWVKDEPEVVVVQPPPVVVIPPPVTPPPLVRRVTTNKYGGEEILLPNGDCMAEINGAIYDASESINNVPTCPKWI